jgi:phage recombination protein Bet
MNAVVSLHPSNDYTGQHLQLIKRTVASDTNSNEFNLFIEVARRAGLDPFRKQISCIVFSKDDEAKRKMSIITNIDGLRAIAARSARYRPDENEAEYVYSETDKGPHNPLGLVKATVTIWIADAARDGGWKPVKGWAYWDEYAPIKDDIEGGYDWIDTGEVWPDTGRPKKKKVPRNAGAAMVRTLDTSGQWGKMPRVMLAKCAEAQALRKAFPEETSGLYEGAELDRAIVQDFTASEIIEQVAAEDRLTRIGAGGRSITLQMFPNAPLERVPLGQVADKIAEAIDTIEAMQILDWFESANRHPLQEFWGWAPGDALELKKRMAAKREALGKADA